MVDYEKEKRKSLGLPQGEGGIGGVVHEGKHWGKKEILEKKGRST